jgi:hypothetical protein
MKQAAIATIFGNLQRESALFGILRFGIICVSKKEKRNEAEY